MKFLGKGVQASRMARAIKKSETNSVTSTSPPSNPVHLQRWTNPATWKEKYWNIYFKAWIDVEADVLLVTIQTDNWQAFKYDWIWWVTPVNTTCSLIIYQWADQISASDCTVSWTGIKTASTNTVLITDSDVTDTWVQSVEVVYNWLTANASITVTDVTDWEDAVVYYIKPVDWTAIHNHTWTLTIEAHKIEWWTDNILSTWTIKLYDPSNDEVTTANWYQTWSDWYTWVLNSWNINNDKIITLKSLSIYTPAFLTWWTNAQSNYTVWATVSNWNFAITIDWVSREIIWRDFSSVTDMDWVALIIQIWIRAITWWLETCIWNTNHFIISSVNTTSSSAITVTSAIAIPTWTDISSVIWVLQISNLPTPDLSIQMWSPTFHWWQSFTLTWAFNLSSVVFKLFKSWSPTWNITCKIYAADWWWLPTWVALWTSEALDSSTVDTNPSWTDYTFTFTTAVVLSASTQYGVVLEQNTFDWTNFLNIKAKTWWSTYAWWQVLRSTDSWSSWSWIVTQDNYFKIFWWYWMDCDSWNWTVTNKSVEVLDTITLVDIADWTAWADWTNGINATHTTLDNQAVVIETDVYWNNWDYTNAFTIFRLFNWITEIDISVATLTLTDTWTTSTQEAEWWWGKWRKVLITALSTDDWNVKIEYTYATVTYTQYFNISKSKTWWGIVYTWDFSDSILYRNTVLRKDIVLYSWTYYLYKWTDNTSWSWGINNWASLWTTFKAVATALLLAEDATITKTLIIWSDVTNWLIKSANYDFSSWVWWAIQHDWTANFFAWKIWWMEISGNTLNAWEEWKILWWQTDYATWEWFFIWKSWWDYKLSIWNLDNYIRWDWTSLIIKWTLDLTAPFVNKNYTVTNLPIPPTVVWFNSPSAIY